MASFEEPTVEDAITLFQAMEEKFPHHTLGDDKWYLVALSALAGCEPEHIGTLYTYLTSKPQYQNPESRKSLVRRLREALLKLITIQGVCKPLEGLFAIIKLERPEDKDYSFSRKGWQAGPENLERGESWLKSIYQDNLNPIMDNFKAHVDFDFIEREIIYGLFLSDHTILGPVDTELVVLTGIMIQNLPRETAWHLRGTRRIGVKLKDVELIQQCVEMVAKFGKVSLHRIPRAVDIEKEV